MRNKKQPFEITSTMLTLAAEIAELVGRVNSKGHLSANPELRRTNRIRTIYSSLAIEQNTLSIDQVTAVISGKRVIAPPKDIKEVQNAYEIYEHIDVLNPYSAEDLLSAHGVMMKSLINEAGVYRSGTVGVADREGRIIHFGTLPQYVPDLVEELMEWMKTSGIHMLIKSCVFHYELELIHPFSDGNGRIGRLWHTLLLSRWNSIFAWLPVESIIKERQDEYYMAINRSNDMGESTVFIEFMLSAIKAALLEVSEPARESKAEIRVRIIEEYIADNSVIMNADVRRILGVSSATANRILAGMVKEDKIEKIRCGSRWGYRRI